MLAFKISIRRRCDPNPLNSTEDNRKREDRIQENTSKGGVTLREERNAYWMS